MVFLSAFDEDERMYRELGFADMVGNSELRCLVGRLKKPREWRESE